LPYGTLVMHRRPSYINPDYIIFDGIIMSMIDRKAPDFETDAYVNGELKKVKLSDYKGRWVVLFFYPADYTFVCPTEIAGFAEEYEKFKGKDCDVLSVARTLPMCTWRGPNLIRG